MWVEQPLKRNTKKTKDTLSLLSTFSENLALRNQLLPDGARLWEPRKLGPGGLEHRAGGWPADPRLQGRGAPREGSRRPPLCRPSESAVAPGPRGAEQWSDRAHRGSPGPVVQINSEWFRLLPTRHPSV